MQFSARLAAGAAVFAAAVLLTGCAASSTGGATTTPTAQPTTVGGASGVPVNITCAEFLPDAVIATYGSGFALNSSYDPPPGSDASQIAAMKGVACQWKSASSGDTIQLAVGSPTAASLPGLKALVANNSQSTTVFGTPPELIGYFSTNNGIGDAEVFMGSGKYWVSTSSTLFTTANHATTVVSSVAQTVPSG